MKNIVIAGIVFFAFMQTQVLAQQFDGLNNNLSSLFMLSDAQTRSISPEKFLPLPRSMDQAAFSIFG